MISNYVLASVLAKECLPLLNERFNGLAHAGRRPIVRSSHGDLLAIVVVRGVARLQPPARPAPPLGEARSRCARRGVLVNQKSRACVIVLRREADDG
jgi:hypothetical protein